jgi:hypothetical protein
LEKTEKQITPSQNKSDNRIIKEVKAMVMEQAKVEEKRINICSNCDCSVYRCDECKKPFHIEQKIFCMANFEHDHLCESCLEEKLND